MTRIRATLKRLIKRSYMLTCLCYVWDDWRMGRRFLRGDIASHSGTLHQSLKLEESLAYIQSVYADYLRYSNLPALSGKAAEVGPGDNCGVGLLLLNGGCHSVDLVDRFYANRDITKQAIIYQEMARLSPSIAELLDGADLQDETTFRGIHRHYGKSASAETFFLDARGYDLILSRAVLEHVRDPLLALRRMAESLNPCGLLLHKVDLRDHGMFSDYHGELKWLEIPGWIHRWMTQARGWPNRILLHQYRSTLGELPIETNILITRLAGVGDIDPHVPYDSIPSPLRERALAFVASRSSYLASEFSGVSFADLSVTGFFLVGRKHL